MSWNICFYQVSPQLMSCIIWKPRKQAYMLYLEHVPVMSHTDFSPLNERYKFQLEMSCKSYYLVVNITGNKKKYNQQAPKTLIWGLCLDLCKCPTLKNTHFEKMVQICFFGNNFWSIQRILKVNDSMDSVSKYTMF